MIKDIIKDLSAKQATFKAGRKTGSNPNQDARLKSNMAHAAVQQQAVRITAALNLYHEMRGSSYRHNVPTVQENGYYWLYDRYYKELVELCRFAKA